jgi:SAM-dependent methyltransferase
LEEWLLKETAALVDAWAPKTKDELRVYLVQGLQDPRISIQKLLVRHFLTNALWPDRFRRPMLAELKHAVRCNLELAAGRRLHEMDLNAFAAVWRSALEPLPRRGASMLEVACGSANDYRFWAAYGLAPHLDYTGIDLNSRNIENARELFPEVRFDVGNVFELVDGGVTFDYVYVSDLFEHLSFRAIEVAVEQVSSVARRAVIVNFFEVLDGLVDHVYRRVPARRYYWHTLSLPKMTRLFERRARRVRALRMVDYLSLEAGFSPYHAGRATLLALM